MNNTKPRLLLIDNDPRTIGLLREWLKEEYDILSANDREEALCIMNSISEQKERINLLITDFYISWSHAWEILIDFKQRFSESPVIVLTLDITDASRYIRKNLKWVFDFSVHEIPILSKLVKINNIRLKIREIIDHYQYSERRITARRIHNNEDRKKWRRIDIKWTCCNWQNKNVDRTPWKFSIDHFRWHINATKPIWKLIEEWLIQFFRFNDWTINRWRHIEKMLWWSISTLIKLFIEFIVLSWSSNLDDIRNDKIMCLDAWWWNWSTMNYLRWSHFDLFWKRTLLSEFTEQVWIADVYHTHLFDLLVKFIKPEYKNDSKKYRIIKEFLSVITNEINRQIRYYSKNDRSKNHKFSHLIDLYNNINWIKTVLKNLSDYISVDISETKIWWEFEDEQEYKISEECKKVIREAIENPELFFNKYFKKTLLNELDNLENDVLLHRENFILMNFNDVRLFMPLVPTFWVIYSCKSMSHIWDRNYERLVFDFFELLSHWWVFIWDWFKESYTRYLRINEIKKFIENDNIRKIARVYIVTNKKNDIQSLLIHKGIITQWDIKFLEIEKLKTFINTWYQIYDFEEYLENNPEMILLNDVIFHLKKKLMYDYQVNDKILDLNVLFKKLHTIIVSMINRVFSEESWNNIKKIKDPEERNAIFISLRLRILNDLEWSSDLIRLRNLLYKQAPWKSKYLDYTQKTPVIIQSFPNDDMMPSWLNSRRVMFPALMPDNSDIVLNKDENNKEKKEIANGLETLKMKNWSNQLHLFEFWNCFTNFPMFDSLNWILEWKLLELWNVTNIDLKQSLENIRIPDEWIIILWWSLDDVYDQYWSEFVEKFVKPLILKIRKWAKIRLLWICFWHQAIASAMWYPTIKWSLEFWITPIRVCENESPFTRHIRWKLLSAVNTRTWYSLIWDKQDWENKYWWYITRHLRDQSWLFDNEWLLTHWEQHDVIATPFVLWDLNTQEINYPPLLVSYENWKIIWSQAHLEARLTQSQHRDILTQASSDFIWNCLQSEWRSIIKDIRSNIALCNDNLWWDRVNFLQHDAWLIILQNILLQFTRDLMREFQ